MVGRWARQAAGALLEGSGARRRIVLMLGALLFLLIPGQAKAHVTDTDMPDAVAETEYLILLDIQPEKTDVRNKLAMVLLRQKKFKEAESELRTILTAEPANFNALDGLGLVMNRTGRPQEAVAQHLAAIKVDPRDAMVHYHLGQDYATLGDAAAAQKAYSQALDLASQPAGGSTRAADLELIRQALGQSSRPPGHKTPAQQ